MSGRSDINDFFIKWDSTVDSLSASYLSCFDLSNQRLDNQSLENWTINIKLFVTSAGIFQNFAICTPFGFEPRCEKTGFLHMPKQTNAKLISAFVFAT